MTGLDLKDRKILYQLDLDARIPTTALAKKVGLSQPACHYRVNNLIKSGAIKFFLTNVDYRRLGYFPYRFFCRLQNISEKKEKELIEYLKGHERIAFLASCVGKYDLMFCIMAQDVADLKKNWDEIKGKYGEYFSEQQNATLISGEFYQRNYLLGGEKRTRTEKKGFGEENNVQLDQKDWIILKELSKSCREGSLLIAEKIKQSVDSVRYRIKNLEKSGVVKGYTIYLDNSKMGQLRYKIMIQLKNAEENADSKIIDFAREFSNVVYSVKTFGNWDLEIDLEVSKQEDFLRILREIKNKFSDVIRDYQIIQLSEVHKYTHFPFK